VGRADGPRAALALLQPVLVEGRLADYAPLHAAHADLLERAGDATGATAAWRRAAELTRNPAEQAALERRAADR
jgi:RNA polymerase sigma-70 factor (ECF subfamily)